jgi:hypothetical protein
LIKILFSKGFIETEILKYNKKLEEEIIKKLSTEGLNIDSRQVEKNEDKIVKNENIVQPIITEEIKNESEIIAKETKTEENNIIKTKIDEEPSKISIFIKEFFAENLFAKI